MTHKKGLSGSTLKIIAITCMFLDHFAASILGRYISLHLWYIDTNHWISNPLTISYVIMHLLGRIAFPLFIFLLVEGVMHTHNQWKYLGRLVLFAFVSEIPFDWALYIRRTALLKGNIMEFTHQNVFFTLSIGLLALILIRYIHSSSMNKLLQWALCIIVIWICSTLASLLHTDYGAIGVLSIAVIYLLRQSILPAMLITTAFLTLLGSIEMTAILSSIPMLCYNGERGIHLKYIFYLFYPVHLLLLGIVCMLMGL